MGLWLELKGEGVGEKETGGREWREAVY